MKICYNGTKVKVLNIVFLLLSVLWVFAIVASFYFLGAYENKPGQLGKISKKWVENSLIVRNPEKPTLLLFLHPHCPCSKATVGSLEFILSRCRQPLEVRVVFYVPENAKKNWEKTSLFHTISNISSTLGNKKKDIVIDIYLDSGGAEAINFGAAISGTALLYSKNSDLVFHGGVTLSRGHFDSGDNFGVSSIVNFINEKSQSKSQTPVFGCPIFEVKGTDVCPNCNQDQS
ncbi:hypothetical protein [Candidatus Uabimicrobium sp. HlEnr_7]|uniref:hypothetical protein n=1 Tax=Candidatus Uabimicrobium helgolandensis TaxID=3095367 RepID=UPI00355778FC